MATGKQIKHYRDKLKWKLKHLSEASNVDIGTISALETRDSVRSVFFAPIAKAFGLTVEQMADESIDYPLCPPSQNRLPVLFSADRDQATVSKLVASEPIPFSTFAPNIDIWSQAALEIMRDLDEGQRQAMVARMREYKQFLGPPSNGQALPVAVKKEGAA